MAWRANLSRGVKEIRFLFCQSSPDSAPAREFVRKNYGDIKARNPSLPVLIRECSGVEPQLWARYGACGRAPIRSLQRQVTLASSGHQPSWTEVSALTPHGHGWNREQTRRRKTLSHRGGWPVAMGGAGAAAGRRQSTLHSNLILRSLQSQGRTVAHTQGSPRVVARWSRDHPDHPIDPPLLLHMGVERCVRLDGLTEAQIDGKLEELAKAGGSLKAK
uniref:Ribosomal protein/NADH dehydrogenase domain-containing protein n=1 Tax=Oryza meridionalis TaxID=40149 RepID=A0A0E0DCA3_9ORYZ